LRIVRGDVVVTEISPGGEKMKFDVVGRIRNMRLPGGRTALMYSIYEAVSNAIHAIEERFGTVEFSK
jgi:hypothetical protein